jgi:hypothetical protein
MHAKFLIKPRDKSQEIGLFDRSFLICNAARVKAAGNSRESHAKLRDRNKGVATAASQPSDL